MEKEELIERKTIPFVPQVIPLGRVEALVDLFNEGRKHGVAIHEVTHYQNGFRVTFEGMKGDAILHDGSYGRFDNEWESYRMPWDGDDVSVHSAEILIRMIKAFKNGEDWEVIENDADC